MINKGRRSSADILFDIFNISALAIFGLIVMYPLYFMLLASFSDPDSLYNGQVWLLPHGLTLDGYRRIFADPMIWRGYFNSILYASLYGVIATAVTLTGAYPLSRKDFKGRNLFLFFILFTMFFNGGLIPTYLVVKHLGMINTIWAMVLVTVPNTFNILIARSFFDSSIPDELREAAAIDGCTNLNFFLRVVLPLSMPIIAVLFLFNVVTQWNDYFNGLIYLQDTKMYPLQLILRNILIQNQPGSMMLTDIESYAAKQRIAELLQYGVIIVAALPLLVLYPFLQRYFVKGMMLGAVKG